MQKLEGILDRELFTDHGRKKTLSPYGRSIYESHCPAYRASVRSLQQCVERLKKDENIAIRVGGHREVLKQFDWAQWHAHKSLELRFLSTAQSLHDLENGKLDLAIVTTKSKLDHIIHKRTKKIDYSWVLSSKLKKRANSFKQLFPILAKENIPFVSYYPTGESRDQFLDNFEENLEEKIEINHQWTCPDWSMILEWLIQKECWSIVPNSLLKAFGELQSGPINQKTPRFFYIAYPEHFKKHKGFQNSIKSIARD